MLDMCNYFFSYFLKSYKMSVAKVKVAQNRHVCDHSERKLQAMFYTYPIQALGRFLTKLLRPKLLNIAHIAI